MGRISASTVLLFISGILLSNHCINGQTSGPEILSAEPEGAAANPSAEPKELGAWAFETTIIADVVATNSDSCPSYVQAGRAICSSYVGLDDLVQLLKSPTFDVCGTSFQHYACADLSNVADNTVYDILNCFITNPDAIITQGGFSLFFNQLSLNTIGFVLNKVNLMVPYSSITARSRQYVLNAVWEKLRQDPQNLSPGSLAIWVLDKLYPFIPAINNEILNCLTTTTVTCEGLEIIVQALHLQYSSFSNVTKDDIGMWITSFIKAKSCWKDTLANSINVYYMDYKSNMNFEDFQIAFGNRNWGSAVSSFTEIQLTQYVESTNAFNSYDSSVEVLNFLGSNDFAYSYGFLSSLPTKNVNSDVLFSLLKNLVEKLNQIQDPLCKPQLNTIFQGTLSYLLVATNETILQMLAPIDCSDFQAIYQGIDIVYDQLSDDLKELVFQYRMNFLNAEATKSESACTYGLNSVQWLEQNFGKSIEYATYADLVRLNLHFDGYQAIQYLNVNQTIDMFIETKIFTSASPSDIETRVTSVTNAWKTKGYEYIKLFLVELKTVLIKLNIKIIVNFQVRFQFLEGMWGIMKTKFPEFTSNDWYSFTESLSYFTSAISTEQLSDLSVDVVEDCSNLHTIVAGFGSGYSDMNDKSISEVTDWISNFLRNVPSHCISEVGDWLVDNYKEFKSDVDVRVLLEINPDYNLVGSINIMVPDQLGQFVMLSSEAHTDITVIEKVFDVLINGTHEEIMEKLGTFWESFSAEYIKTENFTYEVKHYMLQETITELSTSFVSFNSEDTTLWLETRMYPVMSVIDTAILNEIPLEVGCGFQKSFIQAVDFVYTDTLDTNQEDITSHIQKYMNNDQSRPEAERCTAQETSTVTYIEEYFGDYCGKVTYETLASYFIHFDVFQSGVFEMLNSEQFGDMIVLDNVYQSEEKVSKVFSYLQTKEIETVDEVMTRFSETGYTQKIQIVNTDVGQQMLQSYLNIVKTEVTAYNTTQIQNLFESKISILTEFFTTQTLSIFSVQDCDTLVTIVAELNKGFSQMTEKTRTDISSWIISDLKSSSLNGCTSSYTTTAEWTNNVMGSFFMYTTLKQVQEVNSQVNVIEIISETSISQKVEYLVSSNVLTSVNVTMTVLESLKGQDDVTSAQEVVTFLNDFNTAYEQLNVQIMTTEVRQEAMTYLFESFVSDLNSATTEQISSFQETFQYFIPGITAEVIHEIPVTINCDSYKSLLSGISSGHDKFSESVISASFDWIISFLNNQYSSSSSACSSLYTDSTSYIEVIFQSFSSEATIYQYEHYYSEFDAYSCLDVFTGTQLGNLLANTTAITDQLNAALILAEVKKHDIETITSFMTEINMVFQEKNITKLPDSNIQDLIFKTVWPTVTETITTQQDYELWFGDLFGLVISSCTAAEIASLKMDISCSSQSEMVKCFSDVYSDLEDNQKTAMYNRIKDYNQEILTSTASACSTPSGSSGEWLETFWAKFGEQATLADLIAGNPDFNPATALDVCNGVQVAEYAITSGALNNETAMSAILESLNTPNKVKDFLDQCNSAAAEQLQNSPLGDLILNATLEVLSPVINTFQPSDWKEWTQDTLQYVLHNIDTTELKIINYPMTCDSYQELLTGLNNVFDAMSEESRQAVFDTCIQPQFDHIVATSGVKCGSTTDNIEVWVLKNFGEFSVYVEVKQFMEWNVNYNAVTQINNLSPDQLVDVLVSSITKEGVSCQVAARLEQFEVSGVYSFLDTLSTTLTEKNINLVSSVVGSDLLSSSLSIIKSSLSSYSFSDWETLVTVRLQQLFFSINSNQLSILLESADCSAYKLILKQLNEKYTSFTPDTRQSMYGVLNGYISSKKTDSGFCLEGGEDSTTAVMNSFGQFSSYLDYSQFTIVYPNFRWVSAVGILSTSQLATVTLTENVFNTQDQADVIIGRLGQMSFTEIDAYLNAFQAIAQAKSYVAIPFGASSQSIFSAIFVKVSERFSSFTDNQWSNYFGSSSALFSLFFPSFQVSQIQLIPENLNCGAFQSVVSGFSSSYGQLQTEVQAATYGKIKSYLTGQKARMGTACPISGNSGKWLVLNFGEMRVQASMAEIFAINPDFIVTDALSYLAPHQLGSYLASNAVLSDQGKITAVLSAVNSQTIGSFLDAFNAAAEENGITAINNAAAKKLFIGEIFCTVGSGFSSFTAADYSDFFEKKIKMVRSSLDSRAFGFLPTDLGCDALADIMKPLISDTNPDNPSAVFDFVSSALSAQKTNSGSACMGNLDTRSWAMTYFSQYLQLGSWNIVITLNPTFDVASCADLLSTVQLAEASAETNIIQNITVITSVMVTFNGNITALSNFIDTLRQYMALDPTLLSNSQVKAAVLEAVAQSVLTRFDVFTVAEVQEWLTRISFLLPSFNETFLEYIPETISCPQLQAFVYAMNSVYTNLPQPKQKDVANFIMRVLSDKMISGEDVCTTGTSNTAQWVLLNLGQFCYQVNITSITEIYPSVDTVSYGLICVIS